MLRPIYERTKPSRPCVRRVRYSGLWGGSYCRATTLGIGVAPCPTPLRIPGYGHQGCSGRLLVRLSQYGAAVRHSVNWQAAAQVALTRTAQSMLSEQRRRMLAAKWGWWRRWGGGGKAGVEPQHPGAIKISHGAPALILHSRKKSECRKSRLDRVCLRQGQCC